MKQIILQQKETIFIDDIDVESYYIIVRDYHTNELLNYTDEGLFYLVGGEKYAREIRLKELIQEGSEAYQFETTEEAKQYIKQYL